MPTKTNWSSASLAVLRHMIRSPYEPMTAQTRRTVAHLVSQGLAVRAAGPGKRYAITERGRDALRAAGG